MSAQVRGEITSFEVLPRIYALPDSAAGNADGIEPSVSILADSDSFDAALEADPLYRWLNNEIAHLDRVLTSNEQDAIVTLQTIWRFGRVHNTWADLHFPVRARLARELLDGCSGDTVVGLGLEGNGAMLQLFGRKIALGRERLLFFQVRLMKQARLRTTLAAPLDDVTVTIHFAPGENDASEAAYFDKPKLLPSLPAANRVLREAEAPISYRPGQWRILTTPPLLAPIELAPPDEIVPSGWRLDIPNRVQAKFQQLEEDERAATLSLLWAIQRRGGRKYLSLHSKHTEADAGSIYVISPTTDLRVILRSRGEDFLVLADIAYDETLRLFRER